MAIRAPDGAKNDEDEDDEDDEGDEGDEDDEIDEDEILNSGNGKSNPKIAIINAQFEILRNT